jgi:hypothetical protein
MLDTAIVAGEELTKWELQTKPNYSAASRKPLVRLQFKRGSKGLNLSARSACKSLVERSLRNGRRKKMQNFSAAQRRRMVGVRSSPDQKAQLERTLSMQIVIGKELTKWARQ